MAKYVPDIKTQRWVIISQSRLDRPDSLVKESKDVSVSCPFCPGSEGITPLEVYRIGSGEKDKPGWQVRVVPNKYPITDTHEVLIHSPDCENNIEKLSLEHVILIIRAYRDRYRAHEASGQVIIFCNHGQHAGASLKHPHSQLVVVPKQINLDALSREPIQNIVEEHTHFVTYCPDFSQWPFEMWVLPKRERTKFGDITDEEIPDLARVLQVALKRLDAVYNDQTLARIHPGILFGYNYYISPHTDWFMRIIPRFVHRAGFELGTGLSVNIIDPTDAAKILKTVAL